MKRAAEKTFVPQWQIDEVTIRDCPGNRTEVEWREAVRALEKKLQGGEGHCSKCGQSLANDNRYHISETKAWLPCDGDLPRNRWALSAHTSTLKAARAMQKFMGKRAVIWVRTKREGQSTTYRQLEPKP